MQSEHTNKKTLAAMVALAFVSLAVVGLAGTVSADPPEYDQDMGSFNSMSCRFIYTGEGADTVTWDFGDGTETITGMNVDHTYAEKGVYIVTQTSTNDIGSTVATYRVEILGYPTITYNLGYDNQKTVVTQDAYAVPTKTIADPVRSGFTFSGWYANALCTVAYDFSEENKITSPTNVYAKWTATGIVDPEPGTPADGEDKTAHYVMIGIAIVAVIALIAGLITKNPVVLIIGIALSALAALLYTGVFEWSR